MIRYTTPADTTAPHRGFVLPSSEWYSPAETPRVSAGLETLVVGIVIGSVLTACMIALGAWLF